MSLRSSASQTRPPRTAPASLKCWLHPAVARSLRLPHIDAAGAAALLLGATLVQLLPALPPRTVSIAIVLTAWIASFARRIPLPIAWLALGAGWALLRADVALAARLPHALEGTDVAVVGRIVDLPQAQAGATRFEFVVDEASRDGVAVPLAGRVRMSWYGDAPEMLVPCSRWSLVARLRRPRGLVDPGAFDFERSALQQRIVAVGYVRDAESAHALDAGAPVCVDRYRAAIAHEIAARTPDATTAALLRALTVGDQQALDEDAWQVLRATGIGHLIAISGLQIGLFALLGALAMRAVWKLAPRLVLRWPAALIEAPAGLAAATAYSALAGFGLPTERTLIMIAVALLARLARRACAPTQALALAAFAIVAVDPLAVLSVGFWLSFAGVAALMLVLAPREATAAWRAMPRTQLVLSVALVPLGAFFFGQASLVGPLANLVAVPWISFVVVPVAVAAGLLMPIAPTLGALLLDLAALATDAIWRLMQWLATWPSAQLHFAEAPVWAFALATLGVVWALLPRGVPARALGLALALPLLWPRSAPLDDGAFELTVLDVGQGLSVLVRTRDHALIYDAGARFPSEFDLGEAVVVPALRAIGVERLDRLVVSHGDNDHAGGARSVALAFAPDAVESGEPERLAVGAQACVAGEDWTWNGVRFRIVSPPAERPAHDNDRSCALAVVGAHGAVLLPGDASSRVEPAIAASLSAWPHPLALVVPHHGSKTSSSAEFLDAIAPDLALVSTGYRNRFGHPKPEIVARYAERAIPFVDTAQAGYVRVTSDGNGFAIERGRTVRRRYWRE